MDLHIPTLNTTSFFSVGCAARSAQDSIGKNLAEALNNGLGAALVTGVDQVLDPSAVDEGLLQIARGIGSPIQQYGGRFVLDVMPRSVERAFATFSETNDPADLHTDGTYLKAPPLHFLLYCVTQSDEGGVSLLSDSRDVVARLQAMTGGAEALVALQQDYPIRVPDAYALDNSTATYLGAPLLRLDPFSLRWREDTIRDGLTLPHITETQRRAIELFKSALEAMPQTTLRLKPGDLLALNNRFWRHGRTGFAGERLVKRVWIR